MRRILAFLLVLGMLGWPGVSAQGGPVLCYRVDTSGCPDEIAVDLLDDAGGRLHLEVESAVFAFQPQAVTMFLDCACGSMQIGLVQDGPVWVNIIPIDDIDLVVGEWNVTAQGAGSGQTQALATKKLTVTAADEAKPELGIEGLDGSTVTLGAGDLLRISINDTLPGRVTYRADWMPTTPFVLAAPYDIAVGTFRPGPQEVTVTANDRAGHTNTTTFTVFADARDPEVSVEAPDRFYQGIANPVEVSVNEHSAYTVTVSVGGGTASATGVGDGTEQKIEIDVVPQELGGSILRVLVTDALDNEVVLDTATNVSELQTDAVLVDAVPGAPAIQGEKATLNVSAFQKDPLASVTFTVTFDGLPLGTIEVPDNATVSAVVPTDFEPGRYVGVLRLEPPEAVTELDMADQERTITIEVFLARVIHGADRYHIRADDRGLPLEAVGADGSTYELTLENEGLGQVYAFTADGQRLYWNPSSNTTIVSDSETTTTSSSDNGTPGPALVWVTGLLAVAAWAARRRW